MAREVRRWSVALILGVVAALAVAVPARAIRPRNCVDCEAFECRRFSFGYAHCETGTYPGGGMYCISWGSCGFRAPDIGL